MHPVTFIHRFKLSSLRSIAVLATAGLGFTLSPSLLCADVIYQQTFGNSSANNVSLGSAGVDWVVYNANTGADWTYNMSPVSSGPSISGGAGYPADAVNINAQGTSAANGFAFLSSNGDRRALFFTSYAPIRLADYSELNFSWYQANNSASALMRLVVQLDNGQWYASRQAFTTEAVGLAGFKDNLKSFAFTTEGAAWSSMTFTEGEVVVIASTPLGSDLSGEQITAFGLFVDSAGSNSRFDTFAVSGTPAIAEPKQAALLLIGVGGCLAVGLSRRGQKL